MNCIEEIAKDTKVIEIDDQLLVLIKRQVETELMLEEKFRDLCEEVSNFVKEIEDVVNEVERLSCKDVAKETVRRKALDDDVVDVLNTSSLDSRKALDDDDVDVLDISSLDSSFGLREVGFHYRMPELRPHVDALPKALDDDDVDVLDISSLDSRFYEVSDQGIRVRKKGTFCSGVIFCLCRKVLGGKSLRRNLYGSLRRNLLSDKAFFNLVLVVKTKP
ncbi:hypothetical protein Tco_0280902 [Tanacetum coccineum]